MARKKALAQVEGVVFDKEQHTYWSELGLPLMGVTGLMKKHGLNPDYGNIDPDTLAKAAERGTAIHSLLEAYDNGAEVIDEWDVLKSYKKLKLKVLCSEYMVSDGELVASFIDKVLGDYSLADVKTTSEVHTKALEWQLSIYAYLFERQNGIKVPALYCIHVRPGKEAKLILINRIPDEEVEKLLEAERNGVTYVDERETPSASSALTEDKVNTLVSGLEKIETLKAAIKACETAIKAYQEEMMQYMTDNNLDELKCESGVFKRKAAYTRESVDTAKLKAEHPKIYAQYAKTIECKGSITYKSNK